MTHQKSSLNEHLSLAHICVIGLIALAIIGSIFASTRLKGLLMIIFLKALLLARHHA